MDEEVIQRVIYIVIVAVILIVNFIIRMKKKQMQAAQQQQTVSETIHEMPEPSIPVNIEPKSYKEIVPEEKVPSMKSHMHSSLSTNTKTNQFNKLVPENENIPLKITHEELKKAIIYSEILPRRDY